MSAVDDATTPATDCAEQLPSSAISPPSEATAVSDDPAPSTSPSPASASSSPSGGADKPAAKEWSCVKAVGTAVDRNARYRRTMEDEHIAEDRFGDDATAGYFGVYDGHGGRQVVERVKAQLHLIFKEQLEQCSSVEEAWTKSYQLMDKVIADEKIMFSGTTAATVFVRKEKDGRRVAYAANAGDARIVLVKGGQAVRLTYDHKASDQTEIDRIHALGGFVIMNRVNGMLAVTRALGDLTMKEHVTCDPFTSVHELSDDCSHLIVACDGIWDVLTDEQASNFVLNASSAQNAAVTLLRQSLKEGSTDNISVMVVEL